jgi:hypothetical protein
MALRWWNIDVTGEQTYRDETTGRVVLFRSRASVPPAYRNTANTQGHGEHQIGIADLSKYEHPEDADDYRHRTINNVLALVVIVMLTAAGVWLADALSAMRKNHDCLTTGGRGCATAVVTAPRGR